MTEETNSSNSSRFSNLTSLDILLCRDITVSTLLSAFSAAYSHFSLSRDPSSNYSDAYPMIIGGITFMMGLTISLLANSSRVSDYNTHPHK